MSENQAKKYTAILRQLQADILSGKYGKDLPFPSEAALMRRFGVSKLLSWRIEGSRWERCIVRGRLPPDCSRQPLLPRCRRVLTHGNA